MRGIPEFYTKHIPDDIITSFACSGVQGRILRAPSLRKQATQPAFLIYGHHALIERWWGLVRKLQEFGPVILPDLPGFGGMEPFARSAHTIDDIADYLASVIRSESPAGRFKIAGISWGFAIATRTLLRHPDLAARAVLVVSFSGFTHGDDLTAGRPARSIVKFISALTAPDAVARFVMSILINSRTVGALDQIVPASRRRLARMTVSERQELLELETYLWTTNDIATHWSTLDQCFGLEHPPGQLDVDLVHVFSYEDKYIDHGSNLCHMTKIYRSVAPAPVASLQHTLDLNAGLEEYAALIPPMLEQALATAD